MELLAGEGRASPGSWAIVIVAASTSGAAADEEVALAVVATRTGLGYTTAEHSCQSRSVADYPYYRHNSLDSD